MLPVTRTQYTGSPALRCMARMIQVQRRQLSAAVAPLAVALVDTRDGTNGANDGGSGGGCICGRLLTPKSGGLMLQQARFFSSKDDCEPPKAAEEKPSCGSASLAMPCANQKKEEKKKEPEKKKKKKPKTKFKSMWTIEDCPYEPDCGLPVRYDVKYYRITDKAQRKYQVTWDECPRMLIKPKKVCICEKVKRVICRRPRKTEAPKAGAKAICKTMNPMPSCKESTKPKGDCPRLSAPCCRTGRFPPDCKGRPRAAADCTKRNCPYPSFSECKKDPPIDLHPTECKCLEPAMLCEAWAELRRRLAMGRGTKFKCGDLN